MRKRFFAALVIALLALGPAAVPAQADPSWQVCFTPGGPCTEMIVGAIGAARHQILVQAYSFTSTPILAALRAAHLRGVAVEVILDKSSASPGRGGAHYSAATYLAHAGIPVWVDSKVAIAHNKVMVLDGDVVITGSFNFTMAAQNHNAENLLVIHDPGLAAQYRENWLRRQQVSAPYGAADFGSSG
jgi:phosphatidylserine/phosphatidylglycerophosphate/cardiolipin synthase-like enzyme